MIFLLLHPGGFKEPPPRVYTRRHEQQFWETGKYAGTFCFITLLHYYTFRQIPPQPNVMV